MPDTPAVNKLQQHLNDNYRSRNIKVTTTLTTEVYNALLQYVKNNPHLSKEQDAIRLFIVSVLRKEGLLKNNF